MYVRGWVWSKKRKLRSKIKHHQGGTEKLENGSVTTRRIILAGMKEVGVVENREPRIKDHQGGTEKLENE